MFRKIFYSVVRKIEQKGWEVRHAFLENGLQKKLSVNHFLNFNKKISSQHKLFFV